MVTNGSPIARLVQFISKDTVLQSPIDVKGSNYWRLADLTNKGLSVPVLGEFHWSPF